jgi:hypothetical protein
LSRFSAIGRERFEEDRHHSFDSMLRTTSISLTYKELRRDRRYVSPPVTVVLGRGDYIARNWSLSGILLDAAPAFDSGARLTGRLHIAGRVDSFEVTALAVRRDAKAGTLACRFVDPSPAMVNALDAAVAARFLRRRPSRAALGGGLLAGFLLAASPAAAAGSGALVPGSAPLPQFHLNFPNLLIEPLGPPASQGDLQISLTSPDKGVIQFMFSPRSRFGMSTDPETGTSRTYAGLSWNLFENSGFFGNLSLAGSLTRPGAEEMNRRALGPPLALHSMVEFGYTLGGRHSLTLSLDRATAPDIFSERNELDNLHLRYGLKF